MALGEVGFGVGGERGPGGGVPSSGSESLAIRVCEACDIWMRGGEEFQNLRSAIEAEGMGLKKITDCEDRNLVPSSLQMLLKEQYQPKS